MEDEENEQYCCDEPVLCYVHLLKSGIELEEVKKIMKAREELLPKSVKDLKK